jgi:uracil phosphoribosyltransferase
MIIEFSKEHSLLSRYIGELRDVHIQKDSLRFRRNLERIGEIFAYEISKKLSWQEWEVTTPLGLATGQMLKEQPVLATILRAGLPLHQGFLNYFDQADNAFISAYRKHHKDNSFEIKLEYFSSPDLTGREVILVDPMLASGHSIVTTWHAIAQHGQPKHVHIVAVIASEQGVAYVRKNLPKDVTLWLGVVDPELNAHSYIVPGLGDAGDLAYGEKR